MSIANATNILSNMFQYTQVFNLEWIVSLVVTFFTLLIITREVSKWKRLAFPVMLLWHIIGITPNRIIYLLSGVLFVIDALSLQVIGEALSVAYGKTRDIYTERRRDSDIAKIEATERKLRDRELKRRTKMAGGYDVREELDKAKSRALGRAIRSKDEEAYQALVKSGTGTGKTIINLSMRSKSQRARERAKAIEHHKKLEKKYLIQERRKERARRGVEKRIKRDTETGFQRLFRTEDKWKYNNKRKRKKYEEDEY